MKTKLNFKQRIASIQGLRSFKDTLPTKAKKIITKKGELYSKTLVNWKYLVGKDLFKICYPKSYKKTSSKRKCLQVMVKHGYEVDLEYSKKLILDKINYFFGNNVVEGIILKTFDRDEEENKPKEKIHLTNNKYIKKIDNVRNLTVKNSLIKLNKVFKEK